MFITSISQVSPSWTTFPKELDRFPSRIVSDGSHLDSLPARRTLSPQTDGLLDESIYHTHSFLLTQNESHLLPEQPPPCARYPTPLLSFALSPWPVISAHQHAQVSPSLLNIALTSNHRSFSFPSPSNTPFHRHGKPVLTTFFYSLFPPQSTQVLSITTPPTHPSQDDPRPRSWEPS